MSEKEPRFHKINLKEEDIYIKFNPKGKNPRIVYPLRKDIDNPELKGNINWKNMFHGWVKATLIVAFILIITWSYMHDTQECRKLVENPYERCWEITQVQKQSDVSLKGDWDISSLLEYEDGKEEVKCGVSSIL